MTAQVKIESEAYYGPPISDRGYTVRASYLAAPDDANALIQVYKDGNVVREFLFPAYKVWNIAAHFTDIVDSELAGNQRGYAMAGWNGISDAMILIPKTKNTSDDCGKRRGVLCRLKSRRGWPRHFGSGTLTSCQNIRDRRVTP